MVDGQIIENVSGPHIALTYLICAKEFGWTPEETDNVDATLLEMMLVGLERVKDKEKDSIKQ